MVFRGDGRGGDQSSLIEYMFLSSNISEVTWPSFPLSASHILDVLW